MKLNRFIGLALSILVLTGCPEPHPDPPPALDLSSGTWVLNEGNFNWGNASLTFIDHEGEVTQSVFMEANEIPLGDVAQSMLAIDNFVFLVVNNSGVIYKVERSTGEIEGEVTGLTSPRYLLPVGTHKAYVTDLYSGTIHVVDPVTCTKVGEIASGGWTEEMIQVGDEAWVTKMGTDQVLVIDIATDSILDSITVGREPNSIVEDADGKVWVLCGGGLEEEVPELVRIDASTRSVEAEFTFPDITRSPHRLEIDEDKLTLYFLNDGLYRMGIRDTNLVVSPFIGSGLRNFYHFKLQGSSIWITDAKDFVQSGELIRFDLNGGVELAAYPVGAIPGEIMILP